MSKFLVWFEHKYMDDNGMTGPAIIYAATEEEATKIFNRDNPQLYSTFVEEDTDDE